MAAAIDVDLPEDVIVNILSRLPVKSLIRFTSVSKRFQSIILSDSKFAASQFQIACRRKTLTRRLLFSTSDPHLECFDLVDISSHRNCSFPFEQTSRLLGSCNGLVFVGCDDFYVWNPSTGFFSMLPDPGFGSDNRPRVYGVGYVSATDDYMVFAVWEEDEEQRIVVFSSRAQVWKTIQHTRLDGEGPGTLLNEAIHWVGYHEIHVFDFAQEKFRTMRRPENFTSGFVGVSEEGCLCMYSFSPPCIDFWVMRDYGVHESWSKRFSLPVALEVFIHPSFLVAETSLVVIKEVDDMDDTSSMLLMKVDFKEGKELVMYRTQADEVSKVAYEESLIRINV